MAHVSEYPTLLHYNHLSDVKSETSTEGDDHDFHQDCLAQTSMNAPFLGGSSKTKTSLCKNFTEKGFCPYGKRCQFAHGPHELKINRECNRSYKTKECHAFSKKGFCCYGSRCNFIHKQTANENVEEKWENIYDNHRSTFREISDKKTSRLMELLQQ